MEAAIHKYAERMPRSPEISMRATRRRNYANIGSFTLKLKARKIRSEPVKIWVMKRAPSAEARERFSQIFPLIFAGKCRVDRL